MSQYKITLKNDREFLYGFDAPTGGFFYSESDDEREWQSDNGLTLTELINNCKRFGIKISESQMIKDYNVAGDPTPLQKSISLMFGKNLDKMLTNVRKDMKKYVGVYGGM